VQRFCKADLEAMINPAKFKAFCALKCPECGAPSTKRFAKSMPFVVSKMIETFWCKECGRVCCEKHMYQHTCERLDQVKERNAHLTHEQHAARLEEIALATLAKEEAEKGAAREVAEAAEAKRQHQKGRRKLLAIKAKTVDDFIQTMARQWADAASSTTTMGAGGGRGGLAVRNELFELLPRAKRCALTLYNEFEDPTMPGLAEDDWATVKETYLRAKEITGMIAAVDGEPLNMVNPWDPPPEPEQAVDPGPGFGGGAR